MQARTVLHLFPALAVTALLSAVAPAPAHSQNGTWSSVGASAPSVRREYAGVYDRENHRYIIFGGFNGDYINTYFLFNEVWALSLDGTPTWTHLSVAGTPPGERHSPQWGYDAARNRVLIFGGYGSHYSGNSYAYLDDVWELSLNAATPTWNEIHPSGQAPTGRLAGASVYDPMRQRFVGFGGNRGVPVDTWVLNLNGQANWQSAPTSGGSPNGGYGMTSVYDAKGDRMLTFGGSVSDDYWGVNNNVWELSLRGTPKWTQLTPSGTAPSARRSGTAIFDALRNRMVIYGGWDSQTNNSSSFLGDAWALSLGSQPAWSALAPAGTTPSGRDAVSAAYDPINDRMVLFGGWNGVSMLNDTEFLSWGGTTADAVLAADQVATSGTGGTAHVEWDVQNASGENAAVYRRTPGGEWTSLATAEVNGAGRLVYDDAAVSSGTTYDYMMVVGSQRGETFGGETQVQVLSPTGVAPQAPVAFALRGVAPNPVVDRMTVSFALATAQGARLEMIDIAGRRVLDREVGSLGAGVHQVDLNTRGTVPSGLYFLRLTQGGHTASMRVVVSGAR